MPRRNRVKVSDADARWFALSTHGRDHTRVYNEPVSLTDPILDTPAGW